MANELTKAQQRWLELVQASSVALRGEDLSGDIAASASACIIEYRGRRFVLTAAHAVRKKRWSIEIGFDPKVGATEVWHLRGFSMIGEVRRGEGLEDARALDCCFEEIGHSVQPVFEHRTPRGVFPEQRPRPVFTTDLTALPGSGQRYGFAGEIKPEKHGPNWAAAHVTYPGLTYLSSEREVHTFALPVSHPGHEEFRGCSGAPIVGEDGRAFALVLGGDPAKNTIDGLSLAYLKPALDMYCATVPSPYGDSSEK
jgi:hypothetical protein